MTRDQPAKTSRRMLDRVRKRGQQARKVKAARRSAMKALKLIQREQKPASADQ